MGTVLVRACRAGTRFQCRIIGVSWGKCPLRGHLKDQAGKGEESKGGKRAVPLSSHEDFQRDNTRAYLKVPGATMNGLEL